MRSAFISISLLLLWILPAEAQSIQSPSFLQATGGTNPSSNSTTAPEKGNSSLGSLFTDLGHDFARLPSRENLVALGIGGGLELQSSTGTSTESTCTAFLVGTGATENARNLNRRNR